MLFAQSRHKRNPMVADQVRRFFLARKWHRLASRILEEATWQPPATRERFMELLRLGIFCSEVASIISGSAQPRLEEVRS